MRVELIALHAASSYPGAQLYMECAQVNITGTTGTKTASGVAFPGAYKTNDPGIVFNVSGLVEYRDPVAYKYICV